MTRKIIFREKDIIEITQLFESGIILAEIGKIFGCSKAPIGKFLIKFLGIEKYKKIAKEHVRERNQKTSQKIWKNPTEKMFTTCQNLGLKYGPKVGKLPKTQSQINASHENVRKMCSSNIENNYDAQRKGIQKTHEWQAKNHNFISRPEALFYIIVLSKTFFLKDIKPQYFIKELNHRVDFAVPSQKLLFEVDGDYYHSHSGYEQMDKERLERDAEIDKWAKDNSWTIFRYTDAAMRKLGIIK